MNDADNHGCSNMALEEIVLDVLAGSMAARQGRMQQLEAFVRERIENQTRVGPLVLSGEGGVHTTQHAGTPHTDQYAATWTTPLLVLFEGVRERLIELRTHLTTGLSHARARHNASALGGKVNQATDFEPSDTMATLNSVLSTVNTQMTNLRTASNHQPSGYLPPSAFEAQVVTQFTNIATSVEAQLASLLAACEDYTSPSQDHTLGIEDDDDDDDEGSSNNDKK
jgi:hypothetical protein